MWSLVLVLHYRQTLRIFTYITYTLFIFTYINLCYLDFTYIYLHYLLFTYICLHLLILLRLGISSESKFLGLSYRRRPDITTSAYMLNVLLSYMIRYKTYTATTNAYIQWDGTVYSLYFTWLLFLILKHLNLTWILISAKPIYETSSSLDLTTEFCKPPDSWLSMMDCNLQGQFLKILFALMIFVIWTVKEDFRASSLICVCVYVDKVSLILISCTAIAPGR